MCVCVQTDHTRGNTFEREATASIYFPLLSTFPFPHCPRRRCNSFLIRKTFIQCYFSRGSRPPETPRSMEDIICGQNAHRAHWTPVRIICAGTPWESAQFPGEEGGSENWIFCCFSCKHALWSYPLPLPFPSPFSQSFDTGYIPNNQSHSTGLVSRQLACQT